MARRFCKPIYQEWLVAQVSQWTCRAASDPVGAWRDQAQYDIFGAWVSSEWAGHIKPSTDLVKQAKGYQILIAEGAISRDLMSKEITGTKFSKNIKKLRRENEMLAEVNDLLVAPGREAEQEARAEEQSAKESSRESVENTGNSVKVGADWRADDRTVAT